MGIAAVACPDASGAVARCTSAVFRVLVLNCCGVWPLIHRATSFGLPSAFPHCRRRVGKHPYLRRHLAEWLIGLNRRDAAVGTRQSKIGPEIVVTVCQRDVVLYRAVLEAK